MKYTPEEILETILVREVQKSINEEFISELVKAVADPTYQPQVNLKRVMFESPEDEAKWRAEYDEAINRDIDDQSNNEDNHE